jgi:hypothetical protein
MNRKSMEYIEGMYERFLKQFEEKGYLSYQYARSLYDGTREDIVNDWWLSLISFYDRIFYQGRRDALSSTFERATVEVLEEFLGDDKERKLIELSSQGLLEWENYGYTKGKELTEPYCHELREALDSKRTGKGRDKEMVVDTLKFISKLDGFNVLRYTVKRVGSGEIQQHYRELTKIRQIDQKTGRLWLRDIIVTYELEGHLKQQDVELLIPVDTWVEQVALKLGIVDDAMRTEKISKKIVEICNTNDICPIRFGAGLWIIGSHSLELLLERILEE